MLEQSTLETEIVLFHRPDENRKNLFITNIESRSDEATITMTLRDVFSAYGLVNEVLVFKSHLPHPKLKATSFSSSATSECLTKQRYYAIVKFYSTAATRQALKASLQFDGQICKVSYSKRRELSLQQQLYVSRCYELANYYLGFDGWSTHITKMWIEDTGSHVKCVCNVKLTVVRHKVTCNGTGVWKEVVNSISNKGGLCRKVHRIAYNRAIENAFSKLVLVVLGDGRVYADINVANDLQTATGDDEPLTTLEVTEAAMWLDGEDVVDDDEGGTNDSDDERNVNILQQLAAT